MLYYDPGARSLFAREHAERLADDMRRSRRLTPTEAGYPSRVSLGELLRRGRASWPRQAAGAAHSRIRRLDGKGAKSSGALEMVSSRPTGAQLELREVPRRLCHKNP